MNNEEDKAINSNILINDNKKFVLPNEQIDTTAQNIINSSGATSAFDIEKTKAETAKNASTADLTKVYSDILGEEAKKGQYETALGVDTRQSQLDELNQAIYNTSKNYKQYTEDLYKNPNVVASVRGRQISEEERRVASTLADMEFRKASIEGNIEKMKEKAQQIVDLKVAPLKAKAEIAKLTLEKNFDFLSDVQKQKLTEISKKADREAKVEEDRQTKGNEMIINALQSKAPQNLITKAQDILKKGGTQADVASILGDYSMSLADRLDTKLKQAQIDKLNSEITSKNIDAGELVKIGGKEYIRYKDGTISEPILPEAADLNMVKNRLDEKIGKVEGLINDKIALGFSAGPLRSKPLGYIGRVNDWRADVINVVSKLTVDELGRVKSDGVTFGALSNGEREAVGAAATALSAGMIYKGEGDNKTPTGKFKMSEKKVAEELKVISDNYKKDFERRTGLDKMGFTYEDYKKNPDIIKQKLADDLIDETGTILEDNLYGDYPTN